MSGYIATVQEIKKMYDKGNQLHLSLLATNTKLAIKKKGTKVDLKKCTDIHTGKIFMAHGFQLLDYYIFIAMLCSCWSIEIVFSRTK